MESLILFLQVLMYFFVALTIVGLIKPWISLWFLDTMNRMMVLKYYGALSLLLWVVIRLLKAMNSGDYLFT